MVTKSEVAQVFDASVGMITDAVRHFHVFGTVDDASVLVVGGTATVAVFRAPYACKLVEVVIRVETLETADGTLDLCHRPSGTAMSVHESSRMITAVVPTAAGGLTAATDYTCAIIDATLAEGDTVAWMIGTVGEMTGLVYSLKFERLN